MINITSLTQPASPNSRRSSSISALALYNTAVTSTYTHPNNPIHNNSTVVNLYTRQYMQKKKSHRWRLVRTPIPLNPVYRKTLFLAILIPFIGALLFIGATLTPYWENVHFKFIKLLELFSIKQNCSTFTGHENGNMYNKSLINQTEFVILEDPKRWINNNNDNNINNYTLEFVIFRDGKILNWRILKHLYKNCLTVTYKMNEIIGIVVHSYKHITSTENTPKHLSRETITPRLFTRNKYTFTRHEWIQLVEHGDLLDDTQDDEMNRNLWLIMNLQAGIWTMCFRLAEMQNNIISCVVVVYLSVAASVLIGAFSTLFRAVPAAMVTGVLYITSGVFIIFANCIHHTKLNRLEYEWGPCYPISQIPRTLYTPDIISVHPLWPVLVSWISSFVFFIASIIWLILTQLMTFENSKTMI
uniref:Uncharacterized protein n=1 Tax=Schistosoma haematobium TaxID=6185 RepID=A0A094ZFS3_SCHHA